MTRLADKLRDEFVEHLKKSPLPNLDAALSFILSKFKPEQVYSKQQINEAAVRVDDWECVELMITGHGKIPFWRPKEPTPNGTVIKPLDDK